MIRALALVVVLVVACAPRGQRTTIEHDGQEREFILFSPEGAPPGAPVVFVLHGGSGTAVGMQRFSKFNPLAERVGFHVVYPQGLNDQWNDGRVFDGRDTSVDDVGFFSTLVGDIDARLSPSALFITGVSNGAFMTWRLLCDGSTDFRAAAPTIGGISTEIVERCAPAGPVPVMVVQGTEDPLVPYEGGPIADNLGDGRGAVIATEETLALIRRNNNCDDAQFETAFTDDVDDDTSITHTTWTACDAPVQELRIDNGGHTWPGGTQYLPESTIGKVSKEVAGEEVVWSFFETSLDASLDASP